MESFEENTCPDNRGSWYMEATGATLGARVPKRTMRAPRSQP